MSGGQGGQIQPGGGQQMVTPIGGQRIPNMLSKPGLSSTTGGGFQQPFNPQGQVRNERGFLDPSNAPNWQQPKQPGMGVMNSGGLQNQMQQNQQLMANQWNRGGMMQPNMGMQNMGNYGGFSQSYRPANIYQETGNVYQPRRTNVGPGANNNSWQNWLNRGAM